MPAKKPNSINNKHQTKKESRARGDAESAMEPKTKLTITPPAALKGHKIASAEWVSLITLYNELDATIVTKLDERMVITYCKLIEEEFNLEAKVKKLDQAQKDMLANASRIKPNTENLKTWVGMWSQVNGLTANFKGMDARLDGKRKHRLSLEQSLYLTPRSRAGVAPPEKEKVPEKSKTESALE